MTRTVIEREGRLDFHCGRNLRDCPYTEWSNPDSPYSQWRRGWLEAEEESKRENQ